MALERLAGPSFHAGGLSTPGNDQRQDFSKRGYDELYDVEADPSESYSVAERHPEVVAEMKQRLAETRTKFDQFRKDAPPFLQKSGETKASRD